MGTLPFQTAAEWPAFVFIGNHSLELSAAICRGEFFNGISVCGEGSCIKNGKRSQRTLPVVFAVGAEGGTRTLMGVTPGDFESPASAIPPLRLLNPAF